MPDFDVVHHDALRGRVESRVRAADAQAVAKALGVTAAAILSVQSAAPRAAARPAFGVRRFPLRLFSQQLAVLLRAGITLLEALKTLREKEASPAHAATLDAVMQGLNEGLALSQALTLAGPDFDELFIAMVASAERTGQLEAVLAEHARYLAWADELRSKLVAAAVYPAMLVVTSLAVVLFLLVFVVPRFAGLLDGVQGEIAPASRLLIELGRATGEHPWATAALLAALVAAPFVLARNSATREALAALSWRLPMLGEKLRVLALARLYRTLSMLLRAGVPTSQALVITRPAIAAPLRAALDAARVAVERGERLSVALEEQGLATPVGRRLVRVGEQSGRVGDMLGEAAAFHDEELARLSELVTRLVNPLLMLVMGGVIGTVVVLLYLPIFQLVDQVG